MPTNKTKDTAPATSYPKSDRYKKLTDAYALGQQDFLNGFLDYQLRDELTFENPTYYLAYAQGYEDSAYDASFVPELDNPDLFGYKFGQVYQGWTCRSTEYSEHPEGNYWVIRWTNGQGRTGRTYIAA